VSEENELKLEYVLFGFGILLCLAGAGYLAAQYVRFLSQGWQLLALVLTAGMFAFLGKYFESLDR